MARLPQGVERAVDFLARGSDFLGRDTAQGLGAVMRLVMAADMIAAGPAFPERQGGEVRAAWDRVAKHTGEVTAKRAAGSGGVARTKKAAMAIMGHPVGSMRLPSLPLDEGEMAELRGILTGVGWPVPEGSGAVPTPA